MKIFRKTVELVLIYGYFLTVQVVDAFAAIGKSITQNVHAWIFALIISIGLKIDDHLIDKKL